MNKMVMDYDVSWGQKCSINYGYYCRCTGQCRLERCWQLFNQCNTIPWHRTFITSVGIWPANNLMRSWSRCVRLPIWCAISQSFVRSLSSASVRPSTLGCECKPSVMCSVRLLRVCRPIHPSGRLPPRTKRTVHTSRLKTAVLCKLQIKWRPTCSLTQDWRGN